MAQALKVLGRAVRTAGLSLILLGMLALSREAAPVLAAPGQVLIVTETVTGGAGSQEAQAVTLAGKTPVLISAAGLATLTAAQVSAFDALVLGDASCRGPGVPVDIATLTAAAGVWGAAISGNVVVDGTDPVFHNSQGGEKLTNAVVAHVANAPGKTGLYASLSCYYHDTAAATPVPLLSTALGGPFTVRGLGCVNDGHILAPHPALAGVTDADLSNWACSVHEAFDAWPATFSVLVMTRTTGGAYTAPDGSVGWPYVLARSAVSGPGLYINSAAVPEGNAGVTNLNLTVSLIPASADTVTVTYATANGSATAPSDYNAISPTVLTFLPGETSKTFSVQVLGDTTPEANETFFVNLSSPVNATIVVGQGAGAIQDDDTPGGRNLRVNVGGDLTWDAGVGQASYLVTTLQLIPAAPPVSAALPGTATGYHHAAAGNALYCYIVVPVSAALAPLGLSDALCRWNGFAFGGPTPQAFAISLNQSNTAALSWTPPAGGPVDGYTLYIFPLDGSPSSSVPLPAASTSATHVLAPGQFACFVLAATRGAAGGGTDVVCGIEGIATLAAGQPAGSPGARPGGGPPNPAPRVGMHAATTPELERWLASVRAGLPGTLEVQLP